MDAGRRGVKDITEGLAPDGKPWVHPLDRATWRCWLIEHHATSSGAYLVMWRRSTGKPSVAYEDAVEEALCVGWIDATARSLDDERRMQWFTARRPRSGWSRLNKLRVDRLQAAGLMLPAGLGAVDEAKRRGTWSLLDDAEDFIVPDDLAAALRADPPAELHWAAFGRSARRALLGWIALARRPETRAKRIAETVSKAARNERANEWVPRDQRA